MVRKVKIIEMGVKIYCYRSRQDWKRKKKGKIMALKWFKEESRKVMGYLKQLNLLDVMLICELNVYKCFQTLLVIIDYIACH